MVIYLEVGFLEEDDVSTEEFKMLKDFCAINRAI